MTDGAQQALRRTMEIYSQTTRFAFACNDSTKIIEPLQSRCAVLRFTKLTDQEILEKILQICEKEEVIFTMYLFINSLLCVHYLKFFKTKMLMYNFRFHTLKMD